MRAGAKWTVRLDAEGFTVERMFSSSIVENAYIGRAATIEKTIDEMESELDAAIRQQKRGGRK